MKQIGKILAVAATVAYPFAILACLLVFKVSARGLGLCLLGVAALNVLAFSGGRRERLGKARSLVVLGLSLVLAVAALVTNNPAFAKMYPVAVNLALLAVFGFSLARQPTVVFRLACLQDKRLREAGRERDRAEPYCRKVTVVWCCFFVLNACAALCTALWASPVVWTAYNGFIAYILIGALFGGEYLVRRRAMRS